MKLIHILRGAACCSAVLLAALPAFAELEEDESYLPADDPEIETFVSGDYEYSVLVGAEDSAQQAVCIEKYSGSEAELSIPDTLDDMPVVMLGDYAFVDNQTLTQVTIPDSVMGFGSYTFANCTNIKEFRTGAENAFCESRDGILYTVDGTGLLRFPIGQHPESFTVPDGVIAVGNAAFAGCKTLTDISLPDSLEFIGVSAFSDCTGLTAVTLPDSVTTISDFAFNSCQQLAQINLPEGLTSIGNAAFTDTALTEITIPESCTTIGQQAFAATKLTEVTIPPSVTSIGYSAFGWKIGMEGRIEMDDTFIIRGYVGTAADTYASDTANGNSFEFVSLDGQSDSEGAAESPEKSAESAADGSSTQTAQSSAPSGTGKIVGIVVCCLLLAGIALTAVLTGRKGKDKE